MAHGHVRLLAEHIYLHDWAYAFDSEVSAMRLNAIMIPRRRLRTSAGMQESIRVLSWSIARSGRNPFLLARRTLEHE